MIMEEARQRMSSHVISSQGEEEEEEEEERTRMVRKTRTHTLEVVGKKENNGRKEPPTLPIAENTIKRMVFH